MDQSIVDRCERLLLDKVAKLRRLAKSDNVNEAAAAAAATDRLMQEHGIAEAQLEAAGEIPKEAPTEEETPVAEWYGQTPAWQATLASRLVRHYDCSAYGQSGRTEQGKKYALHMIGRPSDLASVRYMYAWLSVEIQRLAHTHAGNGRAWLNSFKHGAVNGVLEAMYESKKAVMAEARAVGSTAMILVDSRAIEAKEERDRRYPNLVSGGRVGGASDSSGFSAGKQAGRSLGTQHKGLQAGGARALRG